ncbi:transmembrane protein, putative (macronuclear) [Tetrahymena thermophila SB210]|uniref:Transmembrane protein, putative n=1 Tax=Tetrahymena thermophila (strain SB210) TaxID=312017 RepID=I7MHU2_TETTS|nr:transmembrane protein, putative [Tetrahymena thermophila SB210]EAS03275.2 transmembrane protein, putative [Tetrahymena thermophila SB210]|eukprot:XP_001023520.2 transmembrane protein, putative [Tetrahymena thermophila SB210]
MRDFSKGFKILVFSFKIILGVLDKISNIVYFCYQPFKFNQIREAMLFFILLSPIIQSVAWSILLAQMRVDIPKPLKMNRVKQSTSVLSFVCNLLISVVEYNVKLLFQIVKYLPQSVMITLLQQIKIFPFCLFGYTYFKYQAILTRDLMKNLAPHLFLFQQIEEEEEQEKKLMKENNNNNNNQIVELKHEQISPKMVSKSINKSISSINISPESSSSPRKIINLKQAFQQEEKPGSQQIPININLDLKNKGSSQRIDSELDDSKNLHNPFLSKSPTNNDQLYQKYFNQNIFQTKKLLNQNSPLKKPHESIDLQNTFGNSVLLMQNQQRKESISSPTRKKNNHQLVAQNTDFFDEDNMHQMRRRATSIKKKGFDKSIQNITQLLKYNNQQQQQIIHHQQQVQQQEVTRKRGISILKRENLNQPNNAALHLQNQQVIPENEAENDQETNDKVFNETDLLLDANIQPTFDTLIQDHNLEQFLLITDVIEAMFEALPMTVIQFINNGINDSWKLSNGTYNLFIYFSFFTSLITIFLHGISLINILYDENIKIFYFTLQFLQKFQMNNNDDKSQTYESDSTDKNKQNSDNKNNNNNQQANEEENKNENLKNIKKKNSKKKAEGFGRIFPMRAEVKLDNLMQLNKLSILRQQASEEIKSLQLFYNGYRYQSQKIINTISKALDKIKFLNKLIIEFDDNFYQKEISPLINKILTEQNNLNNLQISYYGNQMSKEEAYNIYRMINSWHLKIQDTAEDILFQNNSIFIWRCYKLKQVYPNDLYEVFQDRFEALFDTSPSEKYIVEIVLPEKEFNEQECEEFLQTMAEWENLQHLQLIYRSMPRKYESQMNYYVSNSQNLQSCLLVSGKNGLIYNKGYNLQLDKNKNYLQIENRSFIFNYDALKFIFDKNINLILKLQLEEITLNFENQNENENYFKEYHVQSLMKFVQEYKGLVSLNLNLRNNNITPITSESIGQCIHNLSSLIDIELNFSDNRFGAIGVNNIFKFFDKNSRKFRKISINLCRNLIQNEGVGHLIKFLNNQTQKLVILEIQKLNNNNNIGISTSFIESKKDIFLEYLSLDLSNNRFKSDLLDHLLKVISSLIHIKSLELKLNGNIIDIQTEFNFSLLKELNKLGLTFWCNNFSDQSLCNLFKSMRSIKQLEELTFEVVSNNMSDKIQQFQGHLDHLNTLKKLDLVYSKNGKNLTRFKDFDLTLLEIRHLEEFTVDLSNCNFGLAGVTELVKNLYFLSSILKIDLNFSENLEFNDECTNAILGSISSLPQLKILVLNFQKTSITDRTVEAIFKKIVGMTTLRSVTVDFIDNKTTQAAMKYIVDGLLKSNHIQHPQFRI